MVLTVHFLRCFAITTVITNSLCCDSIGILFERQNKVSTKIDLNDIEGNFGYNNSRKNSQEIDHQLIGILRDELTRKDAEIVTRHQETNKKLWIAGTTIAVSLVSTIGTLIYHFKQCG